MVPRVGYVAFVSTIEVMHEAKTLSVAEVIADAPQLSGRTVCVVGTLFVNPLLSIYLCSSEQGPSRFPSVSVVGGHGLLNRIAQADEFLIGGPYLLVFQAKVIGSLTYFPQLSDLPLIEQPTLIEKC